MTAVCRLLMLALCSGILIPAFTGWFLYPLLVPFRAMFPLMILGG
jgi:hypothetical protein